MGGHRVVGTARLRRLWSRLPWSGPGDAAGYGPGETPRCWPPGWGMWLARAPVQAVGGARAELERFGGREVTTTGDGLLATFNGPAQALGCAAAIRRAAGREGLQVRVGVHVGEVEVVGADVRGVAVHEAAPSMARADQGEVLVSEITRTVSLASGLVVEDRGIHSLKGSQASGDGSPMSRILRLRRGDRPNSPRKGTRHGRRPDPDGSGEEVHGQESMRWTGRCPPLQGA